MPSGHDPSSSHPLDAGRGDVEGDPTAADGVTRPATSGELEIAFYPDRVERTPGPVILSPSGALRFLEDPDRVAAAERTSGSRQTVAPAAPARHPQPGEARAPEPAALPMSEPEPIASPITPAEPGEPTAPIDAREDGRDWSTPAAAAPRRPWWRRLLPFLR